MGEARRRVKPGGWLMVLTTEVADGAESIQLREPDQDG